jgi:iron-sulfur cluster assembly protein
MLARARAKVLVADADIMVEMETTTVITVTGKAARKARSLAEREGTPEACLRVRVVAGGCSGFSYELGFEPEPADDDEVIEVEGFRVLVDPRSAPILEGSTLDFNDAMLGGGLKMHNPQAVHECACGDSFSV